MYSQRISVMCAYNHSIISLSPCMSIALTLLVTSYCALRRKDSLCTLTRAQVLRHRNSRWGHPQGDMHMVAPRPGCRSAMVGTGWANFRAGSASAQVLRQQKGWDGEGGWRLESPAGRLLGLAVNAPWLGPGGPTLVLAAWT